MKGTIKKGTEISFLFSDGEKIFTKSILALVTQKVSQNEDQRGRIAIIAGKRLGTAPQRNRAKRRIREAARAYKAPWDGFDVVLVAREKTGHEDFSELIKDMGTIVRRIHTTAKTKG